MVWDFILLEKEKGKIVNNTAGPGPQSVGGPKDQAAKRAAEHRCSQSGC